MKNFKKAFLSQFFTICILFDVVRTEEYCQTEGQNIISQYFDEKTYGPARLTKKIISESRQHTWLHCGTSCLATRFCVAYNYQETSEEHEINCQLSYSDDYIFEKIKTRKKDGWRFYKVNGQRMSGCSEENECQNGGTMVWDPVKPFKCECPENYFGEFCETQIRPFASCLDIQSKGFSQGDGKYLIDPDGDGEGNLFEVHCDMTSFGGGWTMCYTTDSHVNIRTELTTTDTLGYRADCNNIPFTEVMFVDKKSNERAIFTNNGSALTFSGNYDKSADAFGLWTAGGVASTQYKYQMLICDTAFYKGLHFSGYSNGCYKLCDIWCGDVSTSYFRTSAVSDKHYAGVAFNEQGHLPKAKRLISVGIR